MNRISDAVVFDLDGTLVDSRASVLGCLQAFLHTEKIKVTDHPIQNVFGPPLVTTLAEYYPTTALAEAAVKRFQSSYISDWVRHVHLYPGVAAVLRGLAEARISAYIVSSNQHSVVEEIVASTHISGLIECAKGYQSAADTKAVQIRQLLTARVTTKVLVVGDTETDFEAAKENNLKFCGVTYGYRSSDYISSLQPDYIVNSVGELSLLLLGVP